MIRIEPLTAENFCADSLDAYVRTQQVHRVYRRIDGQYRLIDLPYIEDWDLEKKRRVARDIAGSGNITYLALDGQTVVGFVTLEKALHGPYMILEEMHVSGVCRGHGIGRQLFQRARETAVQAGARALYISACSSEETIAFYTAMGAALTDSPIPEKAEAEPCDLQLVCPLNTDM